MVGEDGIGRLAWKVPLEGRLGALPFGRDLWVAAGGPPRILRSIDRVLQADVVGNVKGRGHLFNPRGDFVELPLASLEVAVLETGNTSLTDAAGDFTIPNTGGSDVTVHAELRGPWVDVNDSAGSDLALDQTATPGTPVQLLFHATPPEGNPAEWSQVNGFYHTVFVHDYLRSIIDLPEIDVPIPCNVNVSGTCNAFYTQGTINFDAEGGGCTNMAFDTVIYHEYGHFVDDMIGTITDRALSEGMSDVVATFASGQPLIGEEYRVNQAIRTADNDRTWPALECGTSSHCIGETYAGFAWHAREKLIHALGEDAGKAVAEADFFQSFFANPINIPRAVLEVFLQDDDDGDLSNGTPHFQQLAKAAARHGFEPPLHPVLIFEHPEPPFATVDTVNDYEVRATIRAAAGPVGGATLHYSLDDGSFRSLAMSPGDVPDEWVASIPTQPCGTWIKYYLSATDHFGFERTSPPEAPGKLRRDVHSFHVGRDEPFFREDFESGAPGWVHSANAGEDDWEVGAPNPTGANPFDPTFAYSGVAVYGNDLSQDGDYPDSTDSVLEAPPVDTSPYQEVWVKFHYWISIERSTRDQAKFRVENSSQLLFDGNTGTANTTWMPFEKDISPFTAGNPSLHLRFTLTSNESYHAGGWNIDDVELHSLTCDIVSLALDRHQVRPGEALTTTVQGAPGETAYLLFAHGFGNATFPVPGGPEVPTGLSSDQRLRGQATLDGNGRLETVRHFPPNPNLVGKHYVLVVVSRNTVWQISNYFEFDVVP